MKKYRYSVGIWAFGSCPDRFCEAGYQQTRSFQEKIACASQVPGLDGVEIHYNGDFIESTAEETKKIISESGLKVAAINCEIFGNPLFRKGALISKDPEIRNKAIDIIKTAGEMSQLFKASVVNLWPGADGYDYPFQIDYFDEWNMFIEAIKEIVASLPEVKFSLEYKLREPRVRSTLSTVGKSLLVINEVGADNLGITIDFGHSLMAKENPAESLALLQRSNRLFHTHLNDNSRDWDDDLIIGTYHMWETLEFLYYLQKTNYDGWISLDMSPTRENQREAVQHSIAIIQNLLQFAKNIDCEELHQSLAKMDALESYKFMYKKILKERG